MLMSICDFNIDLNKSYPTDGSILFNVDISCFGKNLNCHIITDEDCTDYDIFCSIDSKYSGTQLSIIKFICNTIMKEIQNVTIEKGMG